MAEPEDSHDGSPEDSSDEEGGGGMVGFLFGNVDRNLQLVDNYMDADALEHLDALGSSRLGGRLGQLQVGSRVTLLASGSPNNRCAARVSAWRQELAVFYKLAATRCLHTGPGMPINSC